MVVLWSIVRRLEAATSRQISSSEPSRKARAAPSRASDCATWAWTTLLSRRVLRAPRGILSRASSMKASSALRAMPSATPAKPEA